jgi:hypothetical protein
MVSLQTLNYAAAFLHFVQAVIVLALIPGLNDRFKDSPPLAKGIYPLQKNLYVIRKPDRPPACDNMPTMHRLLPGQGLQLQLGSWSMESTNFFNFSESAIGVTQNFVVGNVDVRFLIFSFFLLSCLFQGAEAVAGDSDGPRLLRFVEYSFSASVMIMAMAVEVGITDIYTVCCMFTLIFATNILGLMAEALCYLAENAPEGGPLSIWFWILPHALGWVTCLVGYAPLLDAYIHSTRCSDMSPPGFVNVIVILEFCLFNCFGIVQVYSLSSRTALYLSGTGLAQARDYDELMQVADIRWMPDGRLTQPTKSLTNAQAITRRADWAYVILSFTAKTLMAWLILSPTIMGDTNLKNS